MVLCTGSYQLNQMALCTLPISVSFQASFQASFQMSTQFCNGSFLVHKTKKCFSSVALDRGHEQVNAGDKGEGSAVGLTENRAVLMPRPNDRNVPTQHIATLLGATCCMRLATLLEHVATCWMLLAQIWPFQTQANNTQHVATRWTNACIMLNPTVLRYVALACCDRLAGASEDGWLQVLN